MTVTWDDAKYLVGKIPEGHWATYGDLAVALGGTAANANHLIGAPLRQLGDIEIPGAWRVLKAGGLPAAAEEFAWAKGSPRRNRTQQEVLEGEGIRFVNGRAAPSRQLDVPALRELARS